MDREQRLQTLYALNKMASSLRALNQKLQESSSMEKDAEVAEPFIDLEEIDRIVQ